MRGREGSKGDGKGEEVSGEGVSHPGLSDNVLFYVETPNRIRPFLQHFSRAFVYKQTFSIFSGESKPAANIYLLDLHLHEKIHEYIFINFYQHAIVSGKSRFT